MAVCKFWVQGNCRFGNSCKYEHPIVSQNRFGAFGAPSSNSTSLVIGQKDPDNPYSISTAGIVKDLTEERPSWIFSAYGPGRDAPGQLFGGQQTEQSFEELRLHHWKALAAGNPQVATNNIDSLYQQIQRQMDNAIKNPAEAMRFVLEAGNQHPNRLDTCKNNSLPMTTGDFTAGRSRAGHQGGAFDSAGQSTVANPFGRPAIPASNFGSATSPFSQGTGPAFGRPAQLGNGPFGQPSEPSPGTSFGKPSQPVSTFGQPLQVGGTPGFGQPSQLGGVSAFGKPTQLGSTSAFGHPSSLVQKPTFGAPSFGAPSFGQPTVSGFSKFAQAAGASGAPASVFGQPPQPEPSAGAGGFGQTSKLGSGTAFGQPSSLNASSSPFSAIAGNTTSPFAAQSNPNATADSNSPNPFGSAKTTPVNPFGQSAASAMTNTFGQAKAVVNPFGGRQTTPFNQPNSATVSAPNAFQKAVQAQPAFGQPNHLGDFSSARVVNPAHTSVDPLEATSKVTVPDTPAAERQHPPIQSYAAYDTSGNLLKFKGKAVSYQTKDGVSFPAISNAVGKPVKVWFPKGPPPYNKDTELSKEAYSNEIKTQYDAFMRTGIFDGGLMPEFPPRREWCLWDF